MRHTLALLLLLSSAASAHAAAPSVLEACVARLGDTQQDFCTCLDNEAHYSAQGTRNPPRTLATFAEVLATDALPSSERARDNEVRSAWRVMVQNAGLRCAQTGSDLPNPYFGLPY